MTRSNKLNGYLIVVSQGKKSHLEQTDSIFQLLWEKLKGFFGGRDGTDTTAVQLETLTFLVDGEKWAKEKDYPLIEILAKELDLSATQKMLPIFGSSPKKRRKYPNFLFYRRAINF